MNEFSKKLLKDRLEKKDKELSKKPRTRLTERKRKTHRRVDEEDSQGGR